MPRVKITKEFVSKLNKSTANRPRQQLWRDRELIGFGVLESADTSAYFVERRIGSGGRNRRIKIERTSLMSLEAARIQARELILQMAKGIDPAATARRAQTAEQPPTFEEAMELYLSKRDSMRENSRKQYRRDLSKNLGAYFKRPITELDRQTVQEIYNRIEKRSPSVALKVSKLANKICVFAAAHPGYVNSDKAPWLPSSPWTVLTATGERYKLPSRTDFLDVDDLPVFYDAVMGCENMTVRHLCLFLVYSGCRLSEARGLRWDEINWLKGKISLPAARCKTRTGRDIPLTSQIKELLESQKNTAHPHCDYVFYNPAQMAPIAENTFRDQFDSMRERLPLEFKLKPHDLRRTFATHASAPGIMEEFELKLILGHAKDMTATYRQIGADGLKKPMQRMTDFLFNLMTAVDYANAEEAV